MLCAILFKILHFWDTLIPYVCISRIQNPKGLKITVCLKVKCLLRTSFMGGISNTGGCIDTFVVLHLSAKFISGGCTDNTLSFSREVVAIGSPNESNLNF